MTPIYPHTCLGFYHATSRWPTRHLDLKCRLVSHLPKDTVPGFRFAIIEDESGAYAYALVATRGRERVFGVVPPDVIPENCKLECTETLEVWSSMAYEKLKERD